MKKISIMMYSTLKGDSYKGRQLEYLLPQLSKLKILNNVFGLRLNIISKKEDKKYNARTTVLPLVVGFFLRNLLRHTKYYYYPYLVGEKMIGIIGKKYLKKDNSDYIFLKPRPLSLIKEANKMGKFIIIEAGENHPRYTQEKCKIEMKKLKIKEDNIFTDEKAVAEFEESLNYVNKVIVLSEFSKKTYLEKGIPEEKLIKINLGVDPLIEKKIRKYDEKKRMGYVCVATHTILKGTHILINLWEKMNVDADLILIGTITKEIEELLNTKKKSNIILTGPLNKKEIQKIYDKYNTIGVLLSLSEGYPRVIAEYLYAGLPVITTETATCDYIKNGITGVVVPLENEEIIEKEILTLYKNKELYNKYSNNNFNRTIDDYKKEFLEYIENEVLKNVKNSN